MRKSTRGRPVHAPAASTVPRLLTGLAPDERKLVLASAVQRRFRANRVIVRTGDPATSLFLLTKGNVKYYRVTKKGEEVLLWWLTTGDTFGIGTLLAMPMQYVATGQTVDDCELLVWSRDKIRSLAANNKLLAQNALHIVLDALAVYIGRVVGMAAGTAEERLAHTLLQLCRRIGHVQPGGVELPVMNEDLAGLADVSAFTASRQLKQWERQGILQKSRGKVFVLSPERLLID